MLMTKSMLNTIQSCKNQELNCTEQLKWMRSVSAHTNLNHAVSETRVDFGVLLKTIKSQVWVHTVLYKSSHWSELVFRTSAAIRIPHQNTSSAIHNLQGNNATQHSLFRIFLPSLLSQHTTKWDKLSSNRGNRPLGPVTTVTAVKIGSPRPNQNKALCLHQKVHVFTVCSI